TVSVNYMSSSLSRVSKIELPTSALKKEAKVLIVDDFMKGGGTLTGIEELVKEFDGTIAGVCVLCEADFDKEKLIKNYLSLIKISEIDTAQKLIVAEQIGRASCRERVKVAVVRGSEKKKSEEVRRPSESW